MTPEIRKKFFIKTEDTGRFVVTSFRTGKTYAVEPIGDVRTNWGSIDPATGNLVNKKGHDKHRGSIDANESLITAQNGFINIKVHDKGVSPYAIIEQLDLKYPDKQAT